MANTSPASSPKATGKEKTSPKQRRPTHFVCLPLVTDDSVAQLHRSLSYFRSVTATGGDYGPEKRSAGVGEASATGTSRLRLIPPVAHRPAGTFHLTLGAMDLSNTEDMELALRLVQEIDYESLLREAGELTKDHTMSTTRGDHARKRNVTKAMVETDSHNDWKENDRNMADAVAETTKSRPWSLSQEVSPPRTPRIQGSLSHQPNNLDTDLRLNAASTPIALGKPLSLRIALHGLGTFPSAPKARVFYAYPFEPTGILQRFGNLVRHLFQHEGLITETRPLVLHATVANMIYVKGRGDGSRTGCGRKFKASGTTVDARDILKFFNDDSAATDFLQWRGQSSPVEQTIRTQAPPAPSLAPSAPGAVSTQNVPFVWAENIIVDRIRICRMGAQPTDKENWGLEYPPVNNGEKIFFRPADPHEAEQA